MHSTKTAITRATIWQTTPQGITAFPSGEWEGKIEADTTLVRESLASLRGPLSLQQSTLRDTSLFSAVKLWQAILLDSGALAIKETTPEHSMTTLSVHGEIVLYLNQALAEAYFDGSKMSCDIVTGVWSRLKPLLFSQDYCRQDFIWQEILFRRKARKKPQTLARLIRLIFLRNCQHDCQKNVEKAGTVRSCSKNTPINGRLGQQVPPATWSAHFRLSRQVCPLPPHARNPVWITHS